MVEKSSVVEVVPTGEALLNRLKRIEGQVRGLQRMVSERRECHEIVTQLLAARSALDQVGLSLLNDQLDRCFPEAADLSDSGIDFSNLRRVLDLWVRLGK